MRTPSSTRGYGGKDEYSRHLAAECAMPEQFNGRDAWLEKFGSVVVNRLKEQSKE